MKISYNWLKQYIDLKHTPEELKDILTFAGIEVEAVDYLGKELTNIIVAEIIGKEKHPDADKLSVCKIFNGNEQLQVVCGAPNCAKGQKIAFAPVGVEIGGIKIKKTKIRGVESNGMICSEKELGLSDNHEGILVLSEDATSGKSLAEHLNLADVVFEVEITPNRPDLLGMIGIARDLAAKLNLTVKYPQISYNEDTELSDNYLQLLNENPVKCTRYIARVIRDVNVKESPQWLKQYLRAAGINPINNIVDITNYVMMEYGHPLHAFDYDCVKGSRIVVRNALPQEKFSALDKSDYVLSDNDLVIADAENPIAIAGVIGGTNSHITETTRNIVLEAANFLYSTVRKTSGKYKIFTDSAYRFERNISDENAEIASNRATQLILQLTGGKVCKGIIDSFPDIKPSKTVRLRVTRTNSFLGLELSKEQIKSYLLPLCLEIEHEEEDNIYFLIPHFRKDLEREIDLIEEVIRLHGYNNVNQRTFPQQIMNKQNFYMRRNIKDFLVLRGFLEVINWPFADPESLDKLELDDTDKRREKAIIKNPVGYRFSIMQTWLLPNLLKNALFNLNRGQKNLKLFELSKVFYRKNEKLSREEYHVTGICSGMYTEANWNDKGKLVSFFDFKGLIDELFQLILVKSFSLALSDEKYFQPGQGVSLFHNGNKIGELGKLDPKVMERFDIQENIYYFDLNIDALRDISVNQPCFVDFLKTPDVRRDISFIVDSRYRYEEIAEEIRKTDIKTVRNVELFDEYTGKGIDQGFRSLSFALSLNSENKSLTDEQCNYIVERVFKNLKEKFNIEMR